METRVLLLLLVPVLAHAALSGLYVDNGVDRTEMARSLTRSERREVEHEILSLLGLPSRPARAPPSSAAPQFLLDVYKSLLDAPGGDLNLSGRDLNAINESDVIMSFNSRSEVHQNGVRHERGRRLWFDVSEVPAGERIVGAELRLYQAHRPAVQPATVSLYQLVSDNSGEKALRLVDSVVTGREEGWLVLNVTGPLSSWVAFPDSNLGLYLSVHLLSRPAHEMHPEDVGIVTTKGQDSSRQPFMVAFFKSSGHRRTTRETQKRTKKKPESTPAETSYAPHPFIDTSIHWSSRSCQIQTLYVSFRDLEWHDWIIAPNGYDAFYCSGECNFPLNAHMNATNHAIVQTLVHLMDPSQVPKPCCAPTKLSPISVLYFLDESNVILKKYKNMVVKSCGCH
ncbi:protein 60A [Periplaneta americana]|uniref:protein 60A n=1 Tax=Periplaneta americana TaxID=6978 RepID=UPI0037E88785